MRTRTRPAGHPSNIRWRELAQDTRAAIAHDNVVLLSAGVSFFALLSIVPALAAIVAIWGLFAQPADVARVVDGLAASLPDSARTTIEEQLSTVVSSDSTGLGLTAVVGLVVALWSASTATKYLLQAVASVYGESSAGSYVRFRGLALLVTVGAMLFALGAIALIAVLPAALARTPLPGPARVTMSWLRWPLLAIAMMVALTAVYRFAPRRSQHLAFTSIGAVTATLLWLSGSALFAWYAANFGNFNRTYGSMAGVIVLMLWFFVSAFVVVLGAELNVALERAVKMEQPERPRDARVSNATNR